MDSSNDFDITLLDTLTPGERAVLEAISQCGDIRSAAEQLCLSRWTIKTHLQNIHEKLGGQSTMKAVAIFMRGRRRE